MKRLLWVLTIALTLTACGKQTAERHPPTREEITRDSGLQFPDGLANFKIASNGTSLIFVAFGCTADQCGDFAAQNQLNLVAGNRVVTGPSPLWELNIPAESGTGSATSWLTAEHYFGSTTTSNNIRRDVEMVAGTVRIVLSPASIEGAPPTT